MKFTPNMEAYRLPDDLALEIADWKRAHPRVAYDSCDSHPLIPIEFLRNKKRLKLHHRTDFLNYEEVQFDFFGQVWAAWDTTIIQVMDPVTGKMYRTAVPYNYHDVRVVNEDQLYALHAACLVSTGKPVVVDIINQLPVEIVHENEHEWTTKYRHFATLNFVDRGKHIYYGPNDHFGDEGVVGEIGHDILGVCPYFHRTSRTVHGIIWNFAFSPMSKIGEWNEKYDVWKRQAHGAHGIDMPVRATTPRLRTIEQQRQAARENARKSTNLKGELEAYNAKVNEIVAECMCTMPNEKDVIFLGLEIEAAVKNGQDRQEFIRNYGHSEMSKYGILKFDRSAGEIDGLELTSVPASLAWHKHSLNEFFQNHAHKLRTDDRHGIHVHIGRNHLSQLEQVKLCQFMNGNENRDFIKAIAGRATNEYCRFFETKQYAREVKHWRPAPGMEGRMQRRRTVNLQNSATVELRIFQGSVKKNTVFRKLEFAESLARFVKDHSVAQMTEKKYIDFMLKKDNQARYPYMMRWLASKNYIGHERKFIPKLGKVVHTFSDNKLRKAAK